MRWGWRADCRRPGTETRLRWVPDDGPLDAFDPRFGDASRSEQHEVARRRTLVDSQGPGRNPADPKVRLLRIAIPLLAIAGLLVIGAVFYAGLRPAGTTMVLGLESEVRAAVSERPRRVCLSDNNPCAWLTVVDDDRLVAFNTNGPLPEEYGRLGVSWCATSGYFGANSTGSRWDQQGRLVTGPSIRSLDRFTLTTDPYGNLVIDFASLTAGPAPWQLDAVSPPDGPDCEEIPFEPDPDLDRERLTVAGPEGG